MSTAIDLAFPTPELTEGEEILLREIYKNPALRKHLLLLSANSGKNLLGLSARVLSDAETRLVHEFVRGELSVLSTLLDFATIVSQPTN